MKEAYLPDLVWQTTSFDDMIRPARMSEWDRASHSHASSWFQTSRWVTAWWDATGRPESVIEVGTNPGGDLGAVVPLSRSKETLHRSLPLGLSSWRLSGTGVGAADSTGWLSSEDHHRECLARLISLNVMPVYFPNVDGARDPVLKTHFARKVGSTPCLAIPALSHQHFSSRKFAKNIRYYRRRAEGKGINLSYVSPAELSGKHIDSLATLHDARMSIAQEPSTFTATNVRIQELLVDTPFKDKGPCAVVATDRGRTVGILYGFIWRSTFAYYQTGWDPGYSDLSIGTLLVDEALRVAKQIGCERFDFLRGQDSYKYRFGAVERWESSWVFGQSWRALALTGLVRSKGRVKEWRAGDRARPAHPERVNS